MLLLWEGTSGEDLLQPVYDRLEFVGLDLQRALVVYQLIQPGGFLVKLLQLLLQCAEALTAHLPVHIP